MPTRYSGGGQNRLPTFCVALQWQKDLIGLLLSTAPWAPSDAEGEKKGLAGGLAGGKEERGGHEAQQGRPWCRSTTQREKPPSNPSELQSLLRWWPAETNPLLSALSRGPAPVLTPKLWPLGALCSTHPHLRPHTRGCTACFLPSWFAILISHLLNS